MKVRNYFAPIAWSGPLALIVMLGGLAVPSVAEVGRFAAQVNREGPVQVKVTPRSLAADAAVWEFEVAFNTHTVPIDGDPVLFSTLVDSAGRLHQPLGWQGDPPGGHHRRGLLRFKPPEEPSGAVELRINGVGGIATRVFRWDRN